MKKFYFLALFAFAAFALQAQVTVVFSVDMSNVSLSDDDQVVLGGSFQGWTPAGSTVFQDDNEDGIYVATYDIPAGTEIMYKFVINDWGTNEFGDNMPIGDCNDTADGNRVAVIPADETGYYVLPTALYDSCDEPSGQVSTAEVSTISGVKFTPNPASTATIISFENPTNEAHQVIVTSLAGQVVDMMTVTGNNAELSVADYAKGMYFVTFRNEKGEQGTEKLIVE